MEGAKAGHVLRAVAAGVVLSFAAIPVEAHAGVELGIKAGPSFAFFHGSDEYASGILYSIAAGVHADIAVSSVLGIRPEILYVTRGGTALMGSPFDRASAMEVLYATEYLEIPVLLRLRGSRRVDGRPVVFAGPALGLKLRSRIKYAHASGYAGNLDGVRNADLGFTLGAGIGFGRGRVQKLMEIRGTWGAESLRKPATDPPLRNTDMRLLIGATF